MQRSESWSENFKKCELDYSEVRSKERLLEEFVYDEFLRVLSYKFSTKSLER